MTTQQIYQELQAKIEAGQLATADLLPYVDSELGRDLAFLQREMKRQHIIATGPAKARKRQATRRRPSAGRTSRRNWKAANVISWRPYSEMLDRVNGQE